MIQPYFEDPDFAVRLGEVFRDPDAYMTPEEFIAETVLDAEPLFPAGGGYHYSDVHYTLAGLAIEDATGRAYYDLLDEFFLDPLGLDLTLAADRRDLPGLAQGYAHRSSELYGTPLEVVVDGQFILHPLQEWTGGGLVNNPQAMVRWAKLLYEGEAIEGDDLPELLEVGFPIDSTKPHLGYGLAVSVAESEHRAHIRPRRLLARLQLAPRVLPGLRRGRLDSDQLRRITDARPHAEAGRRSARGVGGRRLVTTPAATWMREARIDPADVGLRQAICRMSTRS